MAQAPSVCRNRENPTAGLATGGPVLYDRNDNKNSAPRKARQGDCVMGFLNKKPVIKQEGFQPLELNEGNVQAILNRCLATKDSVDFIGATLFTKEAGFSENSKQIVFDKKVIFKNKTTIAYLYGQLHDVSYSEIITVSSAAIDYKSKVWTKDIGVILNFLHLGYATKMFRPFIKTESSTAAVLLPILPTLSPKDPAFPAWWEEHRAEWEG